jgi:hypothetical protein
MRVFVSRRRVARTQARLIRRFFVLCGALALLVAALRLLRAVALEVPSWLIHL